MQIPQLSHEDLDFVKAKTKKAALSSYRPYNNNIPQNPSQEKFIALQNLSKKGLDHSEILIKVTLLLLFKDKII